MNFSKRTDWPLQPNLISELLETLKAKGRKIVDLTESNPTLCGFSYPKELLAGLAVSRNLNYEPCPQGLTIAREAVCEYYGKKGIAVDPSRVFLTASTSESYSFLFRLLADPGDKILFPRPSYPLFQYLVDLNDLVAEQYRLVYEGRWRVDLAQLRASLEPDAKAVVLVNPNNPTGSSFCDTERREIQALLKAEKIPLICDEVFLDYSSAESSLQSFLTSSENLIFALGGISKSLGLPQMKLGWIVLAGPSQEVTQAQARLEMIADTYLSVNTPAQNALPLWLTQGLSVQQEILARVRLNRQRMKEILCPPLKCFNCEGGWYAVLGLPPGVHDEDFVMRLLREEGVFVHPGYFFDFEEDSFLVVSLLPLPDVFAEGLKRMQRLL